MAELEFLESADAALTDLESDATRRDVLAAVNAVLDQLERDPSHPSVRRHAFSSPIWGGRVWAVIARANREDWLILWRAEGADVVLVLHIGFDTTGVR